MIFLCGIDLCLVMNPGDDWNHLVIFQAMVDNGRKIAKKLRAVSRGVIMRV